MPSVDKNNSILPLWVLFLCIKIIPFNKININSSERPKTIMVKRKMNQTKKTDKIFDLEMIMQINCKTERTNKAFTTPPC